MCGFFGAVSFGTPFSVRDYSRFGDSTDLINYRGPDSRGDRVLRTAPDQSASLSAFDIFLGFRRLSIIDLSSKADQPMKLGRSFMVFNGEIFNFVELRRELMSLGHAFTTAGDSEVLMHVYQEWGLDGFHKLNGMWAFAIADLERGRLVLSRDRFSIKPLYYARVDKRIFFGSEIKQLLPFLPAVKANWEVLGSFLAQAVADHSPKTFFHGVLSVPARHSLVIDLESGDSMLEEYWQFSAPELSSLDDAIETFRELFFDSVRIRLRSDVPIGVLLSGGLDSSGIATVVKEIADSDLETYSVISEQPGYSEHEFIDRLTKDCGLRNRRLIFDASQVLEDLPSVIRHNDEPFLGLHVVAQHKMFQMIRRETDATVLLSGQGSDECFLGYHKFFFFHLISLLKQKRPLAAFRLFASSALRRTTVWQFRMREANRYLPWRQGTEGVKSFLRLPVALEEIGMPGSMRERQIADIERFSIPVQAHFEDRNSMASSLEVRLPFLDYRLVDFAVNLPTDLKLTRGWTKYIVRESLPELPAPIRWRRDKQGFLTPERVWLSGELRPLFESSFQGSRLGELGLVDDSAVLKYYRSFLNGDSRIWYADLTRVLVAELWAREFGIE
jgi:asparagine synthase (glutamine-hydrolysing)